MNITQRIAVAIVILAVDLAVFFVPLSAVFLAYILIFNPLWFRKLLEDMEQGR